VSKPSKTLISLLSEAFLLVT